MALPINYVWYAERLYKAATGADPDQNSTRFRDFCLVVRDSLDKARTDAWIEAASRVGSHSPIPEEGMTDEYRRWFRHTRSQCTQQVSDLIAEAKKEAERKY